MADTKISALPSGAPAQAGDEYVIARSGANYKLTLTNIAASMPPIGATTPNTGAFTTLSASGNASLATLSASGAASFADGTAAAPTVTNTGDTDTGVYFPAANEVAVTTGGTVAAGFNSNGLFFRNRIINGDMRIDQRNAGAAVTTTATYTVDRFTQAFANASCSFQQVADAPAGFVNSLKLTVTTGAAPSVGTNNVLFQRIEGLNVADLAFGTASALTVTVSFWAKASVTGTYAVSLTNSAFNRSYVATYVVNSANTWEYKTVTIAGDTTGTWLTTNGTGLIVLWDFGSGTNLNTTAGAWQAGNFYRTSACTTIASTTNATLQITGVQLETGSVATPFERRPYGTELMLCQRYYYRLTPGNTAPFGFGWSFSTTGSVGLTNFPVTMRVAPSALEQSGTAANYEVAYLTSSTAASVVPAFNNASNQAAITTITTAALLTAGNGINFRSANAAAYLGWSAEL